MRRGDAGDFGIASEADGGDAGRGDGATEDVGEDISMSESSPPGSGVDAVDDGGTRWRAAARVGCGEAMEVSMESEGRTSSFFCSCPTGEAGA